jgi:hypothetical protein
MTGGYSTTAVAYNQKASTQVNPGYGGSQTSRLDALIDILNQKLFLVETTVDKVSDRTRKLTGKSSWDILQVTEPSMLDNSNSAKPSSIEQLELQSSRLQTIWDRLDAIDRILEDNI